MFRKIESKKGVKTYKFVDGHYLEINEDGFFVDGEFIDKNVDSVYCSIWKNSPMYTKNSSKAMYYLGDRIIHKLISKETIVGDIGLCNSEFDVLKMTKRYQFVNLLSGEVIKDLGHLNCFARFYTNENYLFACIGIEFYCYEIQENEVVDKWNISFPEFDLKISSIKLLGVYDNYLLVALSNIYTILSISIENGEITNKWKELPSDIIAGHSEIFQGDYFILDRDVKKLLGTYSTYYLEICLVSKKIECTNLANELSQYGINSFRHIGDNSLTSNHLFLLVRAYHQDRPDTDLSGIVALNKVTKKIDWHYIFLDTRLGTHSPKLHKNKLYQLDLYETLHIFEKI